jgi:hypothetical protein
MQQSQYDNPENVPFTAQDWNRVTELLLKMSAALNKQDFSVPVAIQAQEDKDVQLQNDKNIQVQVDFRVPCQTPSL